MHKKWRMHLETTSESQDTIGAVTDSLPDSSDAHWRTPRCYCLAVGYRYSTLD